MRFSVKIVGLWCTLLLHTQLLFAQTEAESSIEELIVEQIMEDMEESFDISEFTERLRHYLKHPIDLNTADERELSALLFLSPLQIANLLHHRETTGKFISTLELQGIDGFDMQTIEKLMPFVIVGERSYVQDMSLRNLWIDSEQQLMLRYGRVLQRQKGYEITDTARSRYLGDPNRYMVRYRLNFQNNIRLAINMEKDAGEPFFKEKQRFGFDHYGMSLYAKDIGHLKEIVLGDFALQIGQGLVMWNGLGFGKGALISTSARQGIGLRPYTSMNEHNFLRGMATRVYWRKWELTPFASYRKLSGNLTEGEPMNTIATISTSGLHRTPTEQSYRRAITQKTVGLDTRYRVDRLNAGLVVVHVRYNGEITPDDLLRNRYAFRGNHSTNFGFNYQYTFHNIYLYGESAYQLDRGWATNNGLISSLHPQLSLFVNYRHYQRDYHSFFAQALAEGTSVSNEKGVYGGISYHPNRRFEWVNYVDMFRFPWLRYRVDAPSSGMDFLSQFTYTWYKKGKLALRYRHRVREENVTGTTPENYLAEVLKNQMRLEFQYKLSPIWEMRTRIEGVQYEKENIREFGGLVYQDVFWKPNHRNIQANLRLALFHTDSYNARLYAYENDVLYANSFPLYNGKGWRTYLNLRYRLGRRTDFWMRYTMTQYQEGETVGSGLEMSEGQMRSDIKLQMRYQW